MLISGVLISSCDNKSQHETSIQSKAEVNIGRLICGGHLSLAVVEHKFQDDLSTFQLISKGQPA